MASARDPREFEELARRFRAGKVSRRSLMRAVAAFGGAAAVAPWLAACGGAGQAPSAPAGSGGAAPAASPAAAASGGAPVKGGAIAVGIYQEPPNLDPHVSGSNTAQRMMRQLFDTLVFQPEPGKFEPGLATSWEATPDNRAWTFKLRQGVKFHDDTPFNARAVKVSFDRIVDPKTKSLSAIGLLGPYESTEVIDDYTIKVTFKRPFVVMLNNVSNPVLAPASPAALEKYGEDFGTHPVGTGPFKFKEWVPASHATFERWDDYNWAPASMGRNGPAYLDAIQFKFLLEQATRLGAFQKGEVAMIDQTPDQEVANLKADPKYRVDTLEQPGSPQILPLHTSRFPTDELAVRQALIYSLDRKAMTNAVFSGVRPPAYGPLSPNTWSYWKGCEEMYPFSRDKAREVLEAAGWKLNSSTNVREKDGKPLNLRYVTMDDAGNKRPAEFAQAAWKNAGFGINLEAMAYEATAPIMARGEHNIARIGYFATDPEFLYTLYHSDNIQGSNFNRTMTKYPEMDKMIEDMNGEPDRDKRLELSQKIQKFIMDNALIVPLYNVVFVYTVNQQVQNVKYDLSAAPVFYNIWLQK